MKLALLFSLTLVLAVVQVEASSARRILSFAHCTSDDQPSHSLDLSISRVMAPKRLCDTELGIDQKKYTTGCEYTPSGLNYLYQGPAPQFKRKYLFASWNIIKGRNGKIVLRPYTDSKETYSCQIIGSQG